MKNAYAAACLRGSRKHSTPEILLAHYLRTGESEKNAAGTDLLECLGIQFGVAPERIAQRVAVFGKRRGIENNEIILIAHAVEKLEGIFCKSLVAAVAREIQFNVLAGKVDRLGRTVDRMNQLRPPAHGIKREASGVAEHVEHRASAGIAFKQGAVVPLVDKESGLLPFQPVYVETQTVLHGDITSAIATKNETVLFIEENNVEC